MLSRESPVLKEEELQGVYLFPAPVGVCFALTLPVRVGRAHIPICLGPLLLHCYPRTSDTAYLAQGFIFGFRIP